MNRIVRSASLSIAAALLAAAAAFADPPSANISVSADVDNACTISGGNLAFGKYTWLADTTTTMDLTVKCTQNAAYSVALNDGLHAASGARNMSDGTNSLTYALFSDGSGTAWNATATVSDTGNGGNQTHTVHGTISAGQPSAPASANAAYQDTVVATVIFTP
jgi:spore coat protein U domain-containing protein, fimbrial subunit CupE1/2/3/6